MPLLLTFQKPIIILLSLFLSAQHNYSYADNNENLEFKLKAAYLIHLAEFITWKNANKTQDSFSICIPHNNPINSYLQKVSQRLVKGKPLKIVNTLNIEQLKNCHIAYIGLEQTLQMSSLPQLLADYSVLTVSSLPKFAEQGGMIQFYVNSNKVRMRINLAISKKAKLIISSKLLRLMEIVSP